MKAAGLALAMLVLYCGASYANTMEATIDLFSDWTLISLPLVPLNPDPADVFSNFDLMYTVTLQRFDAPNDRYITYDGFGPTTFGGMLLGDGYWFNDPNGGRQEYAGVSGGVPDSDGGVTDMWITLPGKQGSDGNKGGWHLIGQPFYHDTPVDDGSLTGAYISFTDGVKTLTWAEASEESWVDSGMLYWNPALGRYETMGYFFNDDDHFRFCKGYWFMAMRDNLTMIIPAYPAENQP